MKKNRLGLATAVLLVLVGLTAWKLSARKAEDTPPKATAEVKVPKIKADSIDELELTSPDHGKVRLVKQGAEWSVAEPVAAKADQDAVKTALTKIEELEVTGTAATKAKNHERLEVTEAKGTHVVAKGGGKVLLDGFIGIFQSSNSMLRLNGQETVATVKGSVRYVFGKPVREWRDRAITKVETAQVDHILFENKNGRFEFAKDGEAWKQVLAKKEKGITPLDESKVKGLVGTAAALNATDFAEPGVTPEQAGLAADAARATVHVKAEGDKPEQQVVYLIGSQKENNYYLQREGNPTIYLVSQWIGGRLMPAGDTFVKKEQEASAPPAGMPQGLPPGFDIHNIPGLPPGVEPRLGSPQNPIKVEPVKAEAVKPPAKAAAAKPAPAKKAP
jgi:hypothetical protein